MPAYFYEVRDSDGEVILGEADAPSRAELVLELESLRYQILGIREKPRATPGYQLILDRFRRVSTAELALFTRQLSLLMSAGVPILKCFAVLLKQKWGGTLTLAIGNVAEGIRTGKSLSESMSKNPRAFSPVYVNLVKAGEISGGLDEVLKKLSDFLERDMKLYGRLQASLTYPVMIFLVSVSLTLFLMLYIFPAFIEFFEGLDLELPALSQILLTTTRLFTDPWVMFGLVVLLPYVAYQLLLYFATSTSGRRQLAWIILHSPVISTVHKNVMMARFCRTLGILLECAVPVMTSLEVVGSVVGNGLVQEEIRAVAQRVRDGNTSLSQELHNAEFFPPMCGHMLRAAEEAGKMPKILIRMADFYDNEVELSLLQLLALLEPLMLTVMGTVVGFILLAVFLPIYSLLDAL